MQNADILRASLDDLVFEDRNKAYGAYFLRQRYAKHLLKALVIGTVCFTLLISSPQIYNSLNPVEIDSTSKTLVNVDLMQPPPLDETEPPPPPPELPPPIKTEMKFTQMEVVEDKQVLEELPEQEEMEDKNPGEENREGRETGVDPGLLEGVGSTLGEEKKIYNYVEQMPSFPGGDEELLRFIQENLKYPPIAIENEIQGKVLVSFIVDGDGKISEVDLAPESKKLGYGCDKAAIDVVKKMPSWKPGKQNGKPVSVRYKLPITFRLKG